MDNYKEFMKNKVYRAVLEITDDCIPEPLTLQELKDLIQEESVQHSSGIIIQCIELTEVKQDSKC